MSIGVKSEKSKEVSSNSGATSSNSRSGPTSVADANMFFSALDALTVKPGASAAPSYPAPQPTRNDEHVSGDGNPANSYQGARLPWRRVYPSNASGAAGGSTAPATAQATAQAGAGGRLSKWAQDGTAPVDYQGLSAADLRAVGGAGATRLLGAKQVYGDRGAELAADPSMTLAQRQYAGGLNSRELFQTQDAIGQEVEAALSQLMSQEQARKYAADVRNSDLTARDIKDLADIYTRMFGTYQQSSGTSSTSGSSRGSSSGFGFNFGID